MQKRFTIMAIIIGLTLLMMPASTHAAAPDYEFVTTMGDSILAEGNIDNPEGMDIDLTLGRLYVADRDRDKVVVYDLDGTLLFEFGEEGTDPGQFNNLYDIAVDQSTGNLITIDSSNGILVFDSNGTYLNGFDSFDIATAEGIAVDSNTGTIYVANSFFDNCVYAFDSALTPIFNLGVCNSQTGSSGDLYGPEGLTLDDTGTTLFVTSSSADVVEVYDIDLGVPEATYAYTIDTTASAAGALNNPSDVAYNAATGSILIIDQSNDRVVELQTDGTYVDHYDLTYTDFPRPDSITVNPDDGTIYVGERNAHLIAVLNSDGTLNTTWENPPYSVDYFTHIAVNPVNGDLAVGSDGPGYAAIVYDSAGSVRFTLPTGSADGQVSSVAGLGYSPSGDLLVADTGNMRVSIFDSDGSYLSKIDPGTGTSYGVFGFISDVAVDPNNGNIIVVDEDNGVERVHVFDSSGTFLFGFGSSGSGAGQFKFPDSIAIDSASNMYIASDRNDRVQVFDLAGNYLFEISLNGANSVALDSQENLWVSNTFDHTLHVYDIDIANTTATEIAVFGEQGNSRDTFDYIGGGLAIDANDSVYVGDQDDRIVKVWAPTPEVRLSVPDLTMAEGGAVDGFSVWLENPPTDDVTVSLTPSAGVTIEGTSLRTTDIVIPADDWRRVVSVDLSIPDNALVDGDRTETVTVSVSSTDADYSPADFGGGSGVDANVVEIDVSDDEFAPINPGFEDPLSEWSVTGDDGPVTNPQAYEGDDLMLFSANGATEFVQQTVYPLFTASGDEVTIRFYAAGQTISSDGLMGVRMEFMYRDAVVNTAQCAIADRGSFGWKEITCTGTAAGFYDGIRVTIGWMGVSSGLFGVDAVQLTR